MKDVYVPKMGMSTLDVDILEIAVERGARVKPGDRLVEVEGDKATFTIESEVDGEVIDILVEEGGRCKVGDVVMRIREASK